MSCLQHHEDFGYFSDMMSKDKISWVKKMPSLGPEIWNQTDMDTQMSFFRCHLDPVIFAEISSSSVSFICSGVSQIIEFGPPERVFPSVVDQSAGDHQGLLGLLVHLQEVFIAWSAAEPRLPKVHAAGKQEAASAGPNAAPQRCPDLAQPRQTPGFREQSKLLLVNPRHAHFNHCSFQIWVRIHWTDVSSNH